MNHAPTPPGGRPPGSGTTAPQGSEGPCQPGAPIPGAAACPPWVGSQAPTHSGPPGTSPTTDVADPGAAYLPEQETTVAQPDQQPSKPRAGRDLPAAIGVGVGLGAVVVASLLFVKVLFLGVVMAAVGVGVWELTDRLAERKGVRAPKITLVVGSVVILGAAYALGPLGSVAALAVTTLVVLLQRMAGPSQGYLRDVTASVFTACYVPFLATFVALMLHADDGWQRVVLFLLVTVCSDTGAYAVGFTLGKHKLAPRISPGKTREGLAGGIALSMLAGALCMQLMIEDGVWWQGLVLGACIAVTATLGDLVESMIKRDLGIKDMGTLLPGHGGIMDRLDSLLPTAPVAWLLLTAFVGG